jgi:hypothetical protein
VPIGSVEVVNVAVVTALAPVPVVVSVAVPMVMPPLVNVTVPVGDAEAPAIVGTVKVKFTGEPKFEFVGLMTSVSFAPEATATGSEVVDEMAPKLPPAGAVAVTESVPTGKAVVVMVARHFAGDPVGVDPNVVVLRVMPPLAKVTVVVGHRLLTGVTVSVSTTGAP